MKDQTWLHGRTGLLAQAWDCLLLIYPLLLPAGHSSIAANPSSLGALLSGAALQSLASTASSIPKTLVWCIGKQQDDRM
jgi:hypothetical protein